VLSWAPRENDARRAAHEQWRFAALGREELWNLRMPRDFDAASRDITPDDVAKTIRVSASLEAHVQWLRAYAELGVEEVYCFNVGKNQRQFIETFGLAVLPRVRAGE
jgi:hypothetical protein